MSHEENRHLVDLLANCVAECNHCAASCLEEQDVKMLAQCIKLDIDCAEICSLSISFISRGSKHAEHLLRECAEICESCAAECEKHSHMEHCRKCAEVCRMCAEACNSGVAT